MELRHLRYFVAVAEEQNFSQAAERLRMSQPPLSKQIKQFEKELGVKLFDRKGRGVQLTEVGRLFLEEARRILAQVDQSVDMVRQAGDGRIGRLTVGFLPSAAHSVLPTVLREFRERFPGVKLSLQETNPDKLVQRLHDKQINVSFLYLPLNEATLDVKPIMREPLVVALPEAHPLAAKTQVAMHEIADEPFILPPQHEVPGCYGQIMEACRRAGFLPKAVQEDVWLMQTIVGLVAGGIGVALVPASLRNLHRTGVVYKDIKDLSPTVEMGVVWRRDDASAVLRAFLEVVEEIYDQEEGEAEVAEETFATDYS